MYTIELTPTELRTIKLALVSEYYLAKEDGDTYEMGVITRLESKIAAIEEAIGFMTETEEDYEEDDE